jgi:hypothetical protein
MRVKTDGLRPNLGSNKFLVFDPLAPNFSYNINSMNILFMLDFAVSGNFI